MDSHARCWLVVATVAPLVAVLSLWSLHTLHAYRRQWRTTDLFFVAAVAQELINAVFLLGNALLNLIWRPELAPLCSLFVWASVAARTLQLATLTSLVLDVALTARWPYKYRLGVRRHQVRYHLVVLATVAAVVGAAAVFAGGGRDVDSRPSGDDSSCFLLPFQLDRSFVLFLLSLQGALALAGILGALHVHARGCTGLSSAATSSAQQQQQQQRPASLLPNPFLVTDASRAGLASSGVGGMVVGVGGGMAPTGMVNGGVVVGWPRVSAVVPPSVSLVREGVGRPFRWRVILTVLATCLLVNHLPYLVMVAFARFTTFVPPLWLEGGSAYLALVEGLLLPVILWGVDPTYRSSMSQAFVRIAKTGNASTSSYLDKDAASDQTSRLGSMSPHLEPSSTYSSVNSYACNDTLDKKVLLANDINWNKDDDYKYGSPFICLDHDGSVRGDSGGLGLGEDGDLSCMTSLEPIYCDPAESNNAKNNCGGQGQPEDHIYATLSSRYARATVIKIDSLGGVGGGTATMDTPTNRLHDNENDDDDDDNSSVTTSASDDFEFHHMRPPPCTAGRCYDSALSTATDPRPDDPYFRGVVHSAADKCCFVDETPSSASPSRASTLSVKSTEGTTAAPPMYFCSPPPPSYSPRAPPKYVPKSPISRKSGQLARRLRRNASLSMNDIHLLERLRDEEDDTEEIVYVLSGKSESTISLYRIGHEDQPTSPARPATRRSKREDVSSSFKCLQGCNNRSSKRNNNAAAHSENQSESTSCWTPRAHKKHYHRNPKLARGKLHRSSAFHLGQTSSSSANNWSCRPGAFPRQGFPWKQSTTKPFPMPPTTVAASEQNTTSCHSTTYSCRPSVGNKVTVTSSNRHSNRDYSNRGQSYQKKFVSDFL